MKTKSRKEQIHKRIKEIELEQGDLVKELREIIAKEEKEEYVE